MNDRQDLTVRDAPDVKCPKCGGPTCHAGEGIYWCKNGEVCDGFVLTDTGARQLHEEICRLKGMTAHQIIKTWNEESPDDPW